MKIEDMISSFNGDRDKEIRGIFASISILQNRLQTIFDKADPHITLKQFMLLVMIKYSPDETTFTNLGKLLGSSRQNVKKLITSLEKNGFVVIHKSSKIKRKTSIKITKLANDYFDKISNLHTMKLNNIFKDYSDEEVHLFYSLITKLYTGVGKEEI